jgi:hypothetical protein
MNASNHWLPCVINLGQHQVECDIEYEYTPGVSGSREEAPAPPEIDIISVDVDGVHIFRTAYEYVIGRSWVWNRGWGDVVDRLALREVERSIDDRSLDGESDLFLSLVAHAEYPLR